MAGSNKPYVVGIILAAGKGKRMNSHKTGINKVARAFAGRPMIQYGVELISSCVDDTIVVVGAYKKSVQDVLQGYPVLYAHQKRQLGTAHSAWSAMKVLKKAPDRVLLGYGDHMMSYKSSTVRRMLRQHEQKGATITMITSLYPHGQLPPGRVVTDAKGRVLRIVEKKDAIGFEKKIREANAGLYCFDGKFIQQYLPRVKKSPVTGEYYLTELISLAVQANKKVVPVRVAFEEVGYGVNKPEELSKHELLLKKKRYGRKK